MEQISKIPPPQYDQGISAPKTDVMPVSLQGNKLTNLLYHKKVKANFICKNILSLYDSKYYI